MRKIYLILLFVPVLLFSYCGLTKLSRSRSFQVFGEFVPRVETSEPVIALTFDDGPKKEFTEEILQILREEDVKATFFLIGSLLQENPDEGKKIVAAGHEIGNHSFTHQSLVWVTPSTIHEEITKTDEMIRAIGYDAPTHFRPPNGQKLFVLPFYLRRNNRTTVTWDVEPESLPQKAKTPEEIAQNALAAARQGSIVLLHVMGEHRRVSMDSVRQIIRGLKEKGYRLVTVSELLKYRSQN